MFEESNDWEGYRAWFYANLGIADQQEIDLRMNYGGLWYWRDSSPEGRDQPYAADSLEGLRNLLAEEYPWAAEQFDQYVQDGEVRYIEPLPQELPEIAGNDHAAIEALYETGAIALDRVVFGTGIGQEDLDLSVDEEGNLSIRTVDGGGVDIMLADEWSNIGRGIELFEFADGQVMTMRDMLERVGGSVGNHEPTAEIPISDQTATEDAAFSFIVPAGAFADIDAGDSLILGATLAAGSPLPSWLGFDSATGTFAGTPANGDVGTLALTVTATDLAGASAAASFDLAVENVNDAPVTAIPLADQAVQRGDTFTYALPAGAFTDVDAGDTLAYAATLSDGTALPSWLAFDATTGAFSGQAPRNAKGGIDHPGHGLGRPWSRFDGLGRLPAELRQERRLSRQRRSGQRRGSTAARARP
ncbi:MAG: putative Ig domain-containing protein [Candidatus Nitricoxidivorans perseverans]|uniref:Ig domain-containing protein n=1 Tax=Candidatus Nitricoxidivorans perseverans TaxID=2975601 RepID=A0AA49FJK8_9PROT|nr:MAG: putative Ig domain-containing protein [Candidatus Nitricoxidivorans perseverans]